MRTKIAVERGMNGTDGCSVVRLNIHAWHTLKLASLVRATCQLTSNSNSRSTDLPAAHRAATRDIRFSRERDKTIQKCERESEKERRRMASEVNVHIEFEISLVHPSISTRATGYHSLLAQSSSESLRIFHWRVFRDERVSLSENNRPHHSQAAMTRCTRSKYPRRWYNKNKKINNTAK